MTDALPMPGVDEAIAKIIDGAVPLGEENLALVDLYGRIAARDIHAGLTQPPFAASAMDGYAVRFEDMSPGASLRVIGEAPAGAPFDGRVGKDEAVRIFTGAAVPAGADHIVIQEDVSRDREQITVNESQPARRHIRAAGIDFTAGDVLVHAGDKFHEIHGSILAAANISKAPVRKRPLAALFSNGDELVEPGGKLRFGQIVNSNHYALTAMIRRWGGEPDYLGCAPDNEEALKEFFHRARKADIIIPVGGASVGDYDFVKSAFRASGGKITFEKVAVRPGKPTWFGRRGHARIIGLPGNPASAIVSCALFVQPLVRRLCGDETPVQELSAVLTAAIGANGGRESYLRAEAQAGANGLCVTPAGNQDSSLLSPFAACSCLIRRRANAPAQEAGDVVEIVRLR